MKYTAGGFWTLHAVCLRSVLSWFCGTQLLSFGVRAGKLVFLFSERGRLRNYSPFLDSMLGSALVQMVFPAKKTLRGLTLSQVPYLQLEVTFVITAQDM